MGLGALGGALLGVRCGVPWALRQGPPRALDGALAQQVDALFADVDRSRVWDTHVHLVGRGVGTECFVSHELQSRLHPWKNFQYDIYAAAAGLSSDLDVPDAAYLERLLQLHRLANPAGKLVLMAFDMFVDDNGAEVRDKSELYTPNAYVTAVAKRNADVVACASVHPYRKDAIDRLERALDDGARAVKWLPNAMGIDPADARCAPLYDVLARRHVPLISHTGDEQAVDAREAQALGDPRRLRAALERGVTVVAAHVATTGACAGAGSCFEALRALMREPAYARTLFADISACTQVNRAPLLPAILDDEALQGRLVNGSDYPLPAIDPLVSTRALVKADLLTEEDRAVCNAVYARNPLLFDYVLKRKVRAVVDGRERRFLPRVFETAWLFEGAA